MNEKFSAHGFEIRKHPAGYRSIHYIFSAPLTIRGIKVEVQTRTLFEEGWSEIDHTVRYPNFMEDELVGYFLTIFNRMSGNADEMGGFVTRLANGLQNFQVQLNQSKSDKEETLKKMDTLLSALKTQDKESKAAIEKLKAEVTKLKNDRPFEKLYSNINESTSLAKLFGATSQDELNAFRSATHGLDKLYGATSALDVLKKANPYGLLDKLHSENNAIDALKKANPSGSIENTLNPNKPPKK